MPILNLFNETYGTALMYDACADNYAILDLLFAHGADINTVIILCGHASDDGVITALQDA